MTIEREQLRTKRRALTREDSHTRPVPVRGGLQTGSFWDTLRMHLNEYTI